MAGDHAKAANQFVSSKLSLLQLNGGLLGASFGVPVPVPVQVQVRHVQVHAREAHPVHPAVQRARRQLQVPRLYISHPVLTQLTRGARA